MYVQLGNRNFYSGVEIMHRNKETNELDYVIKPNENQVRVLTHDKLTVRMAYRVIRMASLSIEPEYGKQIAVENSVENSVENAYIFPIKIKGMIPITEMELLYSDMVEYEDFSEKYTAELKKGGLLKFAAWEMDFSVEDIWRYCDEGYMYNHQLLERFLLGPDTQYPEGKAFDPRKKVMQLIYRQHTKDYVTACLGSQLLTLKSKVVY